MKNIKQLLLRFGLPIILLISLGLQLSTLDTYSFWFDESYSSVITSESAGDAIDLTSQDVHPPLYYVSLFEWTEVFGRSDFAFRSMSVVFAILSLLLLYKILRSFFTKPVSLFALFIASIAPYTIRYAQEARMYTLASFFILASTLVLIRITQSKKPPFTLWLLYGLLLAGAAYTHYFSMLIIVMQGAYLLYVQRDPNKKSLAQNLIARVKHLNYVGLGAAAMVTTAVYAAWLPKLLDQFQAVSNGFWIPGVTETSFGTIFSYATIFYEAPDRSFAAYAFTVLSIGIGLLMFRYIRTLNKQSRTGLLVLLGGFLLPAVALFVISLVGTSYFYFRYFAQFAPLLYAGLGVVIALMYSKPATRKYSVAAGAVLTISLVIGTSRVLMGVDKTNIEMNSTFTAVNDTFQEGDAVVAVEFFTWYNASHYNRTGENIFYVDEGFEFGSIIPVRNQGRTIDSLDELSSFDRVFVITTPNTDAEVPEEWGTGVLESSGVDAEITRYQLR